MSYQVIARKWRPQTFEEVTGQEHITQTLRNALAHDRLHHAYLFSGARGVGKTTTARLLAKALNCHKTDKPNLNPCRSDDPTACPSCTEIAESRSLDVLEFDAASNTQVDKIREIILQNINIAPARDRYKVFIIDEVHMLSPSSFNALLKTVEEPPDSVVFIMATTELHKVPETIRSRCQEFDFRIIPVQKIFDRLKLIAEAEKIQIDEPALRQVARSGMGSMRDAQSNFDQVISFSGDTISVADVSTALGIASAEMLRRVVDAISENTPKVALDVVADLVSRGQDMRNFSRDLLAVFRDLLVFKVSNGDESLVESSLLTVDEMRAAGERFGEADFLRFFNSLSETEVKLKDAMQPRYVLETGLVKLIEMRRVAPIEDLIERLARLEYGIPAHTDPTSNETAAAATVEKKTLVSEPVDPAPEIQSESPVVREEAPVILHEPPPSDTDHFEQPIIDIGFIESLPVKLAPIDSDALEHFEDSWLDTAYEKKLGRSGDDLLPIPEASTLVETFLSRAAAATASTHTNGSAATPVINPVYLPPVFDDPEPTEEPVVLADNASDEDRAAYAAKHPVIRQTMRIFRAKIVDVKPA